MDRFPPAEISPEFELLSISRNLRDVAPDEPRPGGELAPLLWALAGLLCLMAFVGWLLVG